MILIRSPSLTFLFISALLFAALAPALVNAAAGMLEIDNSPPSRRRRGLGHGRLHRGKCCNYSGETEWVLLDRGAGCFWAQIGNGECLGGWFSNYDCEGMTCGGGFYKVGGILGGQCVTPGNDSYPFTQRRWRPFGCGSDPGALSPMDICGKTTTFPYDYDWGPRETEAPCQPTSSTTASAPTSNSKPPPVEELRHETSNWWN